MAKYSYSDKKSEADAERILTKTLRRRSFTTETRDNLARDLRNIVMREQSARLGR